MNKKPVILVILDGYGINKINKGNAINAADKPNMDKYLELYPNTVLSCSGLDVGLPEGQFGSSEVGHMNIGAGRVVYQYLPRINKNIEQGEFYNNEQFIDAINNCKKNNSNLHLIGLLSDGGIHSHINHLYSLLKIAKKEHFNDVYIHCFLDGRDTGTTDGINYIKELKEKINELGIGKIASVSGRYYAMDRDNLWDRTELAYNAIVLGKGNLSDCPLKAVKQSYEKGITDEFLFPTCITENNKQIGTVNKNDSIIFFNFRGDRARQLTRSIVDPNFKGFKRKTGYLSTYFVCMTEYDKSMPNVHIAIKPNKIENHLGEILSKKGCKQFRIAETQKYAHVTFFFNGGVETVYLGEERLLVPSPKIKNFADKPQMSAYEVTNEVIKRIKTKKYDFILLNYANCDMVGHTGDFDAAVKAVEVVDECLGKVVETMKETNGITVITADHGNCEEMINYLTGDIYTPHTTNKVPFIVIGKEVILKKGKLANIAPTILELMDIDKTNEMNESSLIEHVINL